MICARWKALRPGYNNTVKPLCASTCDAAFKNCLLGRFGLGFAFGLTSAFGLGCRLRLWRSNQGLQLGQLRQGIPSQQLIHLLRTKLAR